MPDNQSEFHAYEIVGEVLLRRTRGRGVLPCKIVRTHGHLLETHPSGTTTVELSAITSGYQTVQVPTWFIDWSDDEDNDDDDTAQSGRPIDVAIPNTCFELLVNSGKPLGSSRMLPESAARDEAPFWTPVAAIRVDGKWVEVIDYVESASRVPQNIVNMVGRRANQWQQPRPPAPQPPSA